MISPAKLRRGKASTAKLAAKPTCRRPTSASSMAASTCMSRRSCAMVNSTGACRLAATVCPASTLRRITVPSTGARMMVRSRSTCACLSSDSRCFTAAIALCTCASLTWICACVEFSCSRVLSTTTRALSSSAGEINFLSTSIFLRSRSRSASASMIFTRPTSARCAARPERATATALSAASRSARVWPTRSS